MKAKATLKQIALEFGVSISTVSKALSDSPEISEATKIITTNPARTLCLGIDPRSLNENVGMLLAASKEIATVYTAIADVGITTSTPRNRV